MRAPIRFAVVAAPAVGGDDPDAELLGEDLLLEAVTELSARTGLDFCCVPGPLLRGGEPEAAEALVGALGSLAMPVYVGLAADDAARVELLEALAGQLPGHPGEAAMRGTAVHGLLPLVLDPAGAPPAPADAADAEGPEDTELWGRLAVHAAPQVAEEYALDVTSGAEPALLPRSGGLRLVLPSLRDPPHRFGLVELQHGRLRLTVHALADPAAPPQELEAPFPR